MGRQDAETEISEMETFQDILQKKNAAEFPGMERTNRLRHCHTYLAIREE